MKGKKAAGAPGRPRRWRWFLPGILTLALLGGAVLYLNRHLILPTARQCHVATGAGEAVLSFEQASNAAVIAAVARSRNLPERAVTIALATALQESHLENLGGGDRDSLGLFQQRPSQGWGTAQQISDPVYATNKFLDGLVKVPGYSRLPLTEAAQAVQKSGFPQAYAKHETQAAVLAGALTGREAAALSCTLGEHAPVAAASPQVGQDGLTAGARRIASQVHQNFDAALAADPSAAADGGRTLRLTPSGSGAETRQAGWAAAHWAVARAVDLGITAVVFDGQRWQAGGKDGWQPYQGPPTAGRVLVTSAG